MHSKLTFTKWYSNSTHRYSSISCELYLVQSSITSVLYSETETITGEGVLGGVCTGEIDRSVTPNEHPLDSLPRDIWSRLIHYCERNGKGTSNVCCLATYSSWGSHFWRHCRRECYTADLHIAFHSSTDIDFGMVIYTYNLRLPCVHTNCHWILLHQPDQIII